MLIDAATRKKPIQLDRLKRLDVALTNRLFRGYQLIRSCLSGGAGLRILFSDKPDWKRPIAAGLALTRHEIAFGAFSPENIVRHDLVVPLTMSDLCYLQTVRGLVAGNPIPIPNLASILLCDDKYRFNHALIASGFGDVVPAMEGAPVFPYILKKKSDEWGEHSHVIHGPRDECRFAAELSSADYFKQALVQGRREYAAHILFKAGRIVRSVTIEYVFDTETPIKGRDRELYKKICRCPFLDLFAAILLLIGFEGLCCFNYKVRDGQPFVFEVNPRFGGSLCPFFLAFLGRLS